MTTSWEDSCSDATRGLSVYTIMRSQGLYTKTEIRTFYNNLIVAHESPGYPELSTEYFDLGAAFLVGAGMVTLVGSTLTPVRLVDSKPAPIRRVPGNDLALEFAP